MKSWRQFKIPKVICNKEFIIVEFFKLEIIAVPLIRHADWMVRNVDFKDNKKNHAIMMFF